MMREVRQAFYMEGIMIELRGICKTFGRKEAQVEALRGISLSVSEGEMVAVMGKSGSGKSTLLNILGGMLSFDRGEYLYNGRAVDFKSQRELTKFRRDQIGFVLQYFALVDELNVFQNVALPLKYQGISSRKIKRRVTEPLDQSGILDKSGAYPSEFSGGQQQRTAIARAIVKRPKVILADEPTGALDEATGEEVQQIFKALNEKGSTVIIVTHDARVAEGCRRRICLRDGMIQETKEFLGDIPNKGGI